jgi:putative peptidoglycan lipid II flippase
MTLRIGQQLRSALSRVGFIKHMASTTAISILQQFIGLARLALIASFFGLSRDYDGYLVVYSVTTIVVFTLASVFDTVAVSRLVQIRERGGDAAFWAASDRLLRQALAAAVLFAAGLAALLWAALPIVAAGFDDAERHFVLTLLPYFIPWVLVILPYYAVSAHLKALWRFHWVFGCEILVMLVSIALLIPFHGSVAYLPLCYAAGYAAAFAVLLYRRGTSRRAPEAAPRGFLGDMSNQYLANQVAGVAGFVDRYFQSFLVAGGISAISYTSQIVNNLSSLLTFREVYVAPLSAELGRNEKLERLLQGIVLISVPSAAFIIVYAEPIIRLLFQRGNFTGEAAVVTAGILQIYAVTLVISSALAPLERMFQILGRISLMHVRNVVLIFANLVLQYVFVFRLHMDVQGIVWAWACSSAIVLVSCAVLVRYCGITIRWPRILGYAAFALGVAGLAAALAKAATAPLAGLIAFILGGAIYALVVGAGLFTIRHRLRAIIA